MGEERAMIGEEGIGGEEESSAVELGPKESSETVESSITPWPSEDGKTGEEDMGSDEEGSMFGNEGSSHGKFREEEEERSG